MDEPYGTDAERRLGGKTVRIAARLSSPEMDCLTRVVKHLGTTPSLWMRHAVLTTTLEGAQPATHEVLRLRLLDFRAQAKTFGHTAKLVNTRIQPNTFDQFTVLLTKLAPAVTPALGLRWALWEQGQLALQRPSKADFLRAYDAVHQQVYDPRNAPALLDARPVTGYLSEGDIS
jgi:hypothetical protein